jgi:undecaprenyl diphosphate synthase
LQSRSESELKHLFSLFNKLTDYLDDFFKNDARCHIIGDMSKLPKDTQERLAQMVEKTKANKRMILTLAINYGGHDEILRAVNKLLNNGRTKVTEDDFTQALDTVNLPDPDLIIRTGGHQRLSGWMPWQTTYSELYFTPTYWPAFDEKDLDKAIAWFAEQQRNHGS